MPSIKRKTYTKNEAINWPIPNYWDVIAFIMIFSIIIMLIWAATQMHTPYDLGQVIPISLKPSHLPIYALRTVLRMFIALFISLVFTFTVGTWAAKNKKAEKILVPAIDVLQSAPVLSFLAITAPFFIFLFKGSMFGPECAAIFAIFTSQVWNMTLSFYQSVKTVPKDLKEASAIFQLSPWQKFWRMEVPFAMPGLLWNMMMSMSGSWFFVVVSEAISVSHQTITLPGIGSYISVAIMHANKMAIIYAIIAMLVVIFLYDQFLFRPLVQWAEKFKVEDLPGEKLSRSWVTTLFQRTTFLRHSGEIVTLVFDAFVNFPLFNRKIKQQQEKANTLLYLIIRKTINILLMLLLLLAFIIVIRFLVHTVAWHDVYHALWLGVLTGIRVLTLTFLCSLIWVPIGVWIGFRPQIAETIQPIIQFLAAFPAYLFFPIVAIVIVKFNLDINIWAAPLMILGTQWYILFNVIAGTSTIPEELRLATKNLGVKGWVRWKRLILPGIFPYFVTGAITAAGGAWNASIVAEAINWGNIKLTAKGLGAYITHYSHSGNFPHVVFGTIIMCLLVVVINRIMWRPLYNLATERFKVE